MATRDEIRDYWRTCVRYTKCPLDFKCMAYDRAYIKCDACEAAWHPCNHKNWELNFMIKRENFKLKLDDKTKEKIKKLGGINNE